MTNEMDNQRPDPNAHGDNRAGPPPGGPAVGDWRQLYLLAESRQRAGAPWAEVLEIYLRAYEARPDRAEPLYRIGVSYRMQAAYQLAYLFLERATRLPRPAADDESLPGRSIYDYALPSEYALCCLRAGRHEQAVKAYNLLLHGGRIPRDQVGAVIRSRALSLEALYPKLPGAPAREHRVKLFIYSQDPGQLLEKCLLGLLNQDYENFHAVFFDDRSTDGSHSRIPQDDGRVTLVRGAARRGWDACLRQFFERHCEPDDLVFPLDATDRLAYCDALTTVNEFFNSYGCAAMYGQYKFSSGLLGLTVPVTDAEAAGALREAGHPLTPFVFRRSLYDELTAAHDAAWQAGEHALYDALLARAGPQRARFSDHILTVVTADPEAARQEGR